MQNASRGSPLLSAFPNDTSALPSNSARVTVRHLAQAPAVDVRISGVGGTIATIPNLSNGQQAIASLQTGNVGVSLLAAGTSTVAFGPVGFRPQGNAYQFLAVGNLTGGSFDVLLLQRDLTPAVPGEIVTTVGGWNCGPTIAAAPATFGYGEPFLVTASGAVANTMAIVNFGDSKTSIGGVQLPLSLTAAGAPGCFLNTNVLATALVMTGPTGTVEFGFTVPRFVFGRLLPGYFQIGTMTAGNTLGWQTSEWLELR